MKQLVILSGKGGTGKTSVAAALAPLARQAGGRCVLADADVDAANLELVLQPRALESHDFWGGAVAHINPELCDGCGLCHAACRFEAVLPADGSAAYTIDPITCDGCAACCYACPNEAVRMEQQIVGRWFRSSTRYGPLVHAELRPTQENSGKLVTLVRQQARLQAQDDAAELVIIDGPPGIGCPVISASSGTDLALIVAEPSAAGIHDLGRILDLTEHFRLTPFVTINKWDIYPHGSEQIRAYCGQRGVRMTGADIPFDEAMPQAMLSGRPVTEFDPGAPSSQAIRVIWEDLLEALGLAIPELRLKQP